MELLINNCNIDIELENEKNTAEISKSINNWASQRNLIFVEANIDGKDFLAEEIPEIEIENVEKMNCIIQSKADLILSTLSEGIAYCDRVIKYIDKSIQEEKLNIEQLEFLYGGLEWLKEMTLSMFRLLDLKIDEVKYMDYTVDIYLKNIDDIKIEIAEKKNENELMEFLKGKKAFFDIFRGIFKVLLLSDSIKNIINRSIDSPDTIITELNNIKKEISVQLDDLEKAAIAFQEGKDKEGIDKLQKFINFLYIYIRISFQIAPIFGLDLSKIIVDNISLEKKNSDINQLLNELVEIMENNDIISLSDILEYEMKPVMENIEQYIDKILMQIN